MEPQVIQIATAHGTINVVCEMTLGDIVIITVVALLVIIKLLQWFLDTLWRVRR